MKSDPTDPLEIGSQGPVLDPISFARMLRESANSAIAIAKVREDQYNKSHRQGEIQRLYCQLKGKDSMSKKKIFSISSDFQLIKKPDWLDDFRKKYDQPYSYHVTLKTSTYFDNNCVENLKGDLDAIAKKYPTIPIKFNELFISSAPKGKCIMIKAQKNKVLIKLQKEIVKKFSEYGSHITKEDERFEKNFTPHITIARHLSLEQLKIAKTELKKDLFCEALIKELVLTTVNNNRFEESSNPLNKAYFKLRNSRNVQS